MNAVLLRPLPYRDADRLVLVWSDLTARRAAGLDPTVALREE